jgi:uncharacterized repeat protein (TIGR01451 family)
MFSELRYEEVAMIRFLHTCYRLCRSRVLLLLLLLAGLSVFVAVQPALAQDRNQAKVYATLHPEPGIAVAPGQTLVYRVEVENVGYVDASSVLVTLDYDPAHLTLLGAEFNTPKDWVSGLWTNEAGRENITITFSGLNENEIRSAAVLMQVNEILPNNTPMEFGTVLQTWMKYYWYDPTGRRDDRQGNAAPVLVAPNPQDSDFVWMAVTPDAGTPDTPLTFYSDRFLPNETMVFWLNGPDGNNIPVNRETRVNEDGAFRLVYEPMGLPAGVYDMVAVGKNSELVGVVSFTVMPYSEP